MLLALVQFERGSEPAMVYRAAPDTMSRWAAALMQRHLGWHVTDAAPASKAALWLDLSGRGAARPDSPRALVL